MAFSKYLCILKKAKAAEYFEGYQTGVACPGGSEISIHGLRDCIERHWNDKDFVTLRHIQKCAVKGNCCGLYIRVYFRITPIENERRFINLIAI